MIAGADLSAFYRQRTDYPPQPTAFDSRVVAWFQDKDWLNSFTRESDDGIEMPLMISGMSCAACTWIVEKFLLQVPGVLQVDINLSLSRVIVTLAPDADPGSVIEQLLKLGYGVRPWRTDERLDLIRSDNKRDLRRLGVAGVGMMQVGMLAIALHAGDLQGMDAKLQQLLRLASAPLTLLVLIYSARSFFSNAWQHLKHGALIMDSSVSIALLLATVASLWATVSGGGDTYYDSVTMFVFFLLLARYLEKRLRNADLIALAQLEDELPEFVARWRDGDWVRCPRDQVVAGDLVYVAAGEAIGFDATVRKGQSAVEESVFNGESLPRNVIEGDSVFAGTVNREASLQLEVSASYRQSRLAALAHDVERARHEKPLYLQLIDRLAARFVALVLIAAVVTALVWLRLDPTRALWSALAVLVVACPCALSLATPAAVASATAWLRRRGVSVRGEFGLLAAADARTVLIDKTGTLTETTLAVGQITAIDSISHERVLALSAALQQVSSHPAARAFHNIAPLPGVTDIEIVAGAGIRGYWQIADGVLNEVRLGSLSFVSELAPDTPLPPDDDHYWVGLSDHGGWLAWIGLAEHLRPGVSDHLSRLKTMGYAVTIVSGDSQTRVAALASKLALPYQGAMTPRDKLDYLQQHQAAGNTVIAVGDGLNDAAFLGAADASIAVAGATALARAQADFVVTDNDFGRLVDIVGIARKARTTMRQNLIWAAGYNIVGIPFAASGMVPPWAAALGMSISSLLVVINALRLRRVSE